MTMPLLRSRVSVIGGLDSRLPLSLFRLSRLFGLFGMIVRILRNESVSVVHNCRGGVLGTGLRVVYTTIVNFTQRLRGVLIFK